MGERAPHCHGGLQDHSKKVHGQNTIFYDLRRRCGYPIGGQIAFLKDLAGKILGATIRPLKRL